MGIKLDARRELGKGRVACEMGVVWGLMLNARWELCGDHVGCEMGVVCR